MLQYAPCSMALGHQIKRLSDVDNEKGPNTLCEDSLCSGHTCLIKLSVIPVPISFLFMKVTFVKH